MYLSEAYQQNLKRILELGSGCLDEKVVTALKQLFEFIPLLIDLETVDKLKNNPNRDELLNMENHWAMIESVEQKYTQISAAKEDFFKKYKNLIKTMLPTPPKVHDIFFSTSNDYAKRLGQQEAQSQSYLYFKIFLAKRLKLITYYLITLCENDTTAIDITEIEKAFFDAAREFNESLNTIDDSVVDHDRQHSAAILKQRQQDAQKNLGFGSVIAEGKIKYSQEQIVSNSEAFAGMSSGQKMSDAPVAMDPRAARLARFGGGQPATQNAVASIEKSESSSNKPLIASNGATTTTPKNNPLLAKFDAEERKRKERAEQTNKEQQDYLNKKNTGTIQASLDAKEYLKNKKPSESVYTSSQTFFDALSPLERFNYSKKHLANSLGLEVKGGLHDKFQVTSNGLAAAILAHYNGIDPITPLVIAENEYDRNTIINAVSLSYSEHVRKQVIILSLIEMADKQSVCLDNPESLNKNHLNNGVILVLCYPDRVGDRYHCIVDKKQEFTKVVNQLCHYQLSKNGDTTLRTWPFLIKATEAKGDCFFIAVGNQVGLPAIKVREDAAEIIEKGADYYSNFMESEQYRNNIHLYLNALKKPRTIWGGHVEIDALEKKYQRPIIVLTYADDVENLRISNLTELRDRGHLEKIQDSTAKPIYLLFNNLNHYDEVHFIGDDLTKTMSKLIATTDEYNTQSAFKPSP